VTKFLFVTDLDHTLVGDDQGLLELSDRYVYRGGMRTATPKTTTLSSC
jgi:hypothetical protein